MPLGGLKMKKDFLKENKEIVRGIMIFIAVILALVLLFFVSENIGDRSADKSGAGQQQVETNPLLEEGQVLDENKMKSAEKITMDDLKALLKKKTTSVVMLAQDSCYWCQQQKPILESLMYEYDLDVKYLDVSLLSEEDYLYLTELHEDLEELGTPTFISVQNKKVRLVSPDAKNRTGLLKMFADMGVIE